MFELELTTLRCCSPSVRRLQVVDPKKASYGVENPLFAVTQLAQTTMRSDIGKISLDKTFEERDTLNRNIVEAIRCRVQTLVREERSALPTMRQHKNVTAWQFRRDRFPLLNVARVSALLLQGGDSGVGD